MAEQIVEVPDGKILFPFFIKDEDVALVKEAFASMVPNTLDPETQLPILTVVQRGKKGMRLTLQKAINRFQRRKARQEVVITKDVIE
jgi:hypothetical protein